MGLEKNRQPAARGSRRAAAEFPVFFIHPFPEEPPRKERKPRVDGKFQTSGGLPRSQARRAGTGRRGQLSGRRPPLPGRGFRRQAGTGGTGGGGGIKEVVRG